MKKLFFVFLLFLFVFPVRAEPVWDAADNVSEEGLSHVQEILPDFSFREAARSLSQGTEGGLLHLFWEGLVSFALGQIHTSLSVPITIAGLAVLSSLLGHLGGEKGAGEIGFFLTYASCIGLAAAAVGDAAELAQRTAQDMATFTGAALPALAMLSLSAGSVGAAGIHPALLSAGAAASLLVTRVGIPAMYISLSLSLVGNLSSQKSLRMLSAIFQRVSLWLVCGSLTLFAAVIGVTGYAAGTLDGITAKGIKYAVSGLIPVLGNILSDAAEAVSFSAITIKNAAGAAGILFLLLLTLYPVIKTAITSLLYRLASAIASAACDSRIANALQDMADMLSALAGMTAAAGVLSMLTCGMLTRFADMGVMLR